MRKNQTSRPVGTTRRASALLLCVVALLVGIAGTATAAKLITGAQIKDGSVHGRDLTNESVTGKDVKNGSLTKKDFTGSLRGEPGPAGPEGPAGPTGPQGTAGVSGLVYPIAAKPVPANGSASWFVECPAGKKAVGGGVSSTVGFHTTIRESAPLNFGAGWAIVLHNGSNAPTTAYAWAACVNAS